MNSIKVNWRMLSRDKERGIIQARKRVQVHQSQGQGHHLRNRNHLLALNNPNLDQDQRVRGNYLSHQSKNPNLKYAHNNL